MLNDTSGQTILLVEDDPIIALAERRVIEKGGYRVLVAHTGEKAVELAGSHSDIDLVLMDIDLGAGITGTEAAQQILGRRALPLTFLSSHTEPEIVNTTEGITAYGYIVKNSGEMVLLASIKMALRLHMSERRFQQVVSQVRDVAVQGYAADGTTTYWNTASEELYGYPADEAIGKKLWELIIPAEMVVKVKQAVDEMLKTGIPLPPETLSLMHKDGSLVSVRSNHSITMNAKGESELFCLDIPVKGQRF